MATKLTKDLTRETDILFEDKPVSATLSPDEGGVVKFRVKGARKESSVSLKKVFGMAANIPRTPVIDGDSDAPSGVDLVSLNRLEARIMMDGAEVMTPEVKGVLFGIVREILEDAREDAGLPPIQRRKEKSALSKAYDALGVGKSG